MNSAHQVKHISITWDSNLQIYLNKNVGVLLSDLGWFLVYSYACVGNFPELIKFVIIQFICTPSILESQVV